MKQVGLNVAADSLMSSAYTGVVGGFVVISCDDPGPHSSQTEQDSRFFSMFAKVPALDPSSPAEARDMVQYAFQVSERFQIPVILRPAIRVCHAKQSVVLHTPEKLSRKADFEKNPERWAATPRFRLVLHRKLNETLVRIREEFEGETVFNREISSQGTSRRKGKRAGIISGGVSFSNLIDIVKELHLEEIIDILKIGTSYPLPMQGVLKFIDEHDFVLVIEETDPVIEMQLPDRGRVMGRFSGHIPGAGELTPDILLGIIGEFLANTGLSARADTAGRDLIDHDKELKQIIEKLKLPVRRPSLCAGCPERAAFFAIRRVLPKAIYTSDIGCYTLGLNLNAVDTVLDMGAGITLASGLYQAYHQDGVDIPIVATMGDSTFYHSGTAALLNAVYNKARFILVVLDNETTAMTGMQPTPGTGITADGHEGNALPLERVIRGCGIDWLRTVDPYDVDGLTALLKDAQAHTHDESGGIAVIIARHPCLINNPEVLEKYTVDVEISAECNGCGFCVDFFECPAIYLDDTLRIAQIDRRICVRCGVCLNVCPRGSIYEKDTVSPSE
jgi:indolepyruvate ferredoxin oxidoreductase alpha subunit